MKKFCCILLACVMIFTGFSTSAFAYNYSDHVVSLPKNLNSLKLCVDDTFDSIIAKNAEYRRGELLDCMCYSNLLADHYIVECNKKEFKKFIAKMYIFAGELMWKCYNGDARIILLEMYFFERAAYILQSSDDCELRFTIDQFLESRINAIKANCINLETLQGESLNDKINSNIPKNNEEFLSLLEESSESIFENCLEFLDGSELFIKDNNPKNNDIFCDNNMSILANVDSFVFSDNVDIPDDDLCKLKLDNNVYSVRFVVNNILRGSFYFGNIENHVAMGAFY